MVHIYGTYAWRLGVVGVSGLGDPGIGDRMSDGSE